MVFWSVLGSVERPNSVPEKRVDTALLLHGLSDGPPPSSQQAPGLLPVQQVHLLHRSNSTLETNCSRFSLCREILQPRDMVTIPADNNTYMHFCGQFCLSVFRHKRKQVDKVPDKPADKRLEKKPEKPPEKPLENQLFCSICKATNKVRHQLLVL